MNKIMRLVDKAAVTKQGLQMQEHIHKADNETDINVAKENLDIAKGMFEVLNGLVLEQINSFKYYIKKADKAMVIDNLKENLDIAKGIFETLDRLDLIPWRGHYIAELKMLEEKYNNYLNTYLGESKKL